jgi:hypothetical protein
MFACSAKAALGGNIRSSVRLVSAPSPIVRFVVASIALRNSPHVIINSLMNFSIATGAAKRQETSGDPARLLGLKIKCRL